MSTSPETCGNLGAALVAVLLPHGHAARPSRWPARVVSSARISAPVADLGVQLAQLVLDFQNLQAGQAGPAGTCTMASACGVVKAELLHDGGFGLGLCRPCSARMAAMISSTMSTARFRPSRIWARSSAFFRSNWVRRRTTSSWKSIYFCSMLLEGHDLGHAAVQRQHDDAHGVLQLGIAVQLVQHHLGVGVAL